MDKSPLDEEGSPDQGSGGDKLVGVTKDVDRRALLLGTGVGPQMELQRKLTKRQLKKSLVRRDTVAKTLIDKLGSAIKTKIAGIDDVDPSKGPEL